MRSLSDMGVIVIGSRLAAKMPKKNFLNFFESLSKEKSVERLSFRSSGNQTRYLGGQIEKGEYTDDGTLIQLLHHFSIVLFQFEPV